MGLSFGQTTWLVGGYLREVQFVGGPQTPAHLLSPVLLARNILLIAETDALHGLLYKPAIGPPDLQGSALRVPRGLPSGNVNNLWRVWAYERIRNSQMGRPTARSASAAIRARWGRAADVSSTPSG